MHGANPLGRSREDWDSNPGASCPANDFQDRLRRSSDQHDESERGFDLPFRVSLLPLDSLGLPANCGPIRPHFARRGPSVDSLHPTRLLDHDGFAWLCRLVVNGRRESGAVVRTSTASAVAQRHTLRLGVRPRGASGVTGRIARRGNRRPSGEPRGDGADRVTPGLALRSRRGNEGSSDPRAQCYGHPVRSAGGVCSS